MPRTQRQHQDILSLIRTGFGLILFALLGVAGCASADAYSEAEPRQAVIAEINDLEIAMRGVSTVSLHPIARLARPQKDQSDAKLRNDTDAAILDLFRDRGYQIAPPGHGDRIIAYAIGASEELTDRQLMQIFGMTAGMSDDPDHPRGGLVIVLIDGVSGQVLWRTGASSEREPNLDRQRSIRAGVAALLDNLPRQGV